MVSEASLILFWFLSAFLIGLFCMGLAEAKNRSPWLWLALGWTCGWIALIALAGMPTHTPSSKI